MDVEQIPSDDTHPNPLPSNYRKIELQSPQDLTYLQDNLAKVALEKLNFVLPDNPSRSKPATVISLGGQHGTDPTSQTEDNTTGIENDPLKEQVRNLISEFLQNTWKSAQENLTLNGLDASDIPVPHTATLSQADQSQAHNSASELNSADGSTSRVKEEREGIDFTYSPFDARLQHRLANLHGELEKLTAEVSKLRREAPRKAATTFETSLSKHITTDDESYATAQQRDANTQPDGLKLSFVRDDWSADVKEKYVGGVRELGGLAGVSSSSAGGNTDQSDSTSSSAPIHDKTEPSLTETMGKALRARDVVHEME